MFVAIGPTDRQARFDDAALLLGEGLSPGSVYGCWPSMVINCSVMSISPICSSARGWGARRSRRGQLRR